MSLLYNFHQKNKIRIHSRFFPGFFPILKKLQGDSKNGLFNFTINYTQYEIEMVVTFCQRWIECYIRNNDKKTTVLHTGILSSIIFLMGAFNLKPKLSLTWYASKWICYVPILTNSILSVITTIKYLKKKKLKSTYALKFKRENRRAGRIAKGKMDWKYFEGYESPSVVYGDECARFSEKISKYPYFFFYSLKI